MPKIYIYKLAVDDSGAPCVEKGLLSLPRVTRCCLAGKQGYQV